MIDTLKLCIQDYAITDEARLTLKQPSIDLATGEAVNSFTLWKTPSGRSIEGAGAYFNGGGCRIDITPKPNGAVYCFVESSLPKYATGDNYSPIGQDEVCQAIEGIGRQLAELGIRTNLADSRLSRIDTFKNVVADESFGAYHPLFPLLQLRRLRSRDYGTSFLWSNSQQELSIYDKGEEIRNRGGDPSAYPKNTIRFEHRLKSGSKIRKTLGVGTVRELLNNYGTIAEHHEGVMRDQVFRHSPEEIEVITENDHITAMLHFRAKYGRNWESRYFAALGQAMAVEHGGIEAMTDAVAFVAGGTEDAVKKRVYRFQRKVEDARTELGLLRGQGIGGKTLITLYNELRTKALGMPVAT